MKTFAQGINVEHKKQSTEHRNIEEASIPARVVIPLLQHTGAICEPLVKVGDEVVEGQKIGDCSKLISAPVHASISGKVTKIAKFPYPCGADEMAVVIEGNGNTEHRTQSAELRDIVTAVREAGIVGLGGAAFPTHVKLSPPKDKKIDTLVVNGCECEPYITADHRIMLERADAVIQGARLAAKAVNAARIIIGVEDNKRDAVKALRAVIRQQHIQEAPDGVEVISLETKYPQGGEKMLIKTLLDREVPSGELPFDIGVMVINVGTAVAIAEAVECGQPLIKRVMTVTGSGVKEPKNLLVRIGTTFQDIIDQCGGLTEDAAKVIMGGPMMGLALATLDLPVVKATSCLLVLNRKETQVFQEKACIRCGRCIGVCPAGLMPNFLADYAKLQDWDSAGANHVADCIECGCCAYICPSRIFLTQYFKAAKLAL